MATVEKSIEVAVPVTTAYNQWTQFESFPMFMEGVVEVRQISDNLVRWKAEVGGRAEEWDAEISEQIPDKRIAWHSLQGASNAGVVTFHYVEPERTRVMLQMEYEPDGIVEAVGDKLGFVSRRVEGDLERFKQLMEKRQSESGGWRGEIPAPPDR